MRHVWAFFETSIQNVTDIGTTTNDYFAYKSGISTWTFDKIQYNKQKVFECDCGLFVFLVTNFTLFSLNHTCKYTTGDIKLLFEIFMNLFGLDALCSTKISTERL